MDLRVITFAFQHTLPRLVCGLIYTLVCVCSSSVEKSGGRKIKRSTLVEPRFDDALVCTFYVHVFMCQNQLQSFRLHYVCISRFALRTKNPLEKPENVTKSVNTVNILRTFHGFSNFRLCVFTFCRKFNRH